MTSAANSPFPVIREAVAAFPDRAHCDRVANELIAAGFSSRDLSVIVSHRSHTMTDIIPAGLSDEIKYIGPLTVAGVIVVSGGPIAATVAALVGAGLGGAALKEIFDRYIAMPHRNNFTAALKAGEALLWVRCNDSEIELRAVRILEEAGGRHVHVHARSAQADAGLQVSRI
jgi:hypothetical protein